MTKYDVAVVGAGPSGSGTAYHLAKSGANVILLDRAKYPREKPCGGGITARCFKEAPVDISPVVEQVINTVRFSYKLGGFFDHSYPETLVYMTQRHRLDAFLAEQAAAAGAVFQDDSQVREIELSADGVKLSTERDTIEAAVLIGADGSNGIVARSAGLVPFTEPPVALEANFPYQTKQVPPGWRDVLGLELGSMAGGYGWSFPKEDHFNVGCGGWHGEGTRLREHLSALRTHYGLGSFAMENIRGHHLPTREGNSPISKGRVILVGDAAGLVDPMSGEGIHSAFVSGRIAAESVQRFLNGNTPDLWHYEAAIEREMMPDLRAAEMLRDAYHYTPRPCYEVLKRSSMLRKALCQLITGEKTYAAFIRQLGPLQTVLRFWGARGRAARATA